MNTTVAVIVTYNRIELLKQCIKHLKAQTVPVDIIIVDNASTDGTADLFKCAKTDIHYYNTGSNLGGAGGFNYGIRKAIELGYELIWVMDDDTLPSETAHEKLLQADKKLNGEYGFLSSKVLWKDETLCNMNVQKITKWKKIRNYDIQQKIQYASFVSLFLRADVVRKFGLPYKEFFIWSDDWEYTRRISKEKYGYYVPDSVVKHWCNENIGANLVSADITKTERFKYLYRNDIVLYRQDKLDGYIYLFLRTLMHTIKVLLNSDSKLFKIKLMFSSLRDGLKFNPEIEYIGK